VNVVWLKRDLRFYDHAPLYASYENKIPTLLVYCYEPMLFNDSHYSPRHFDFVWQSLQQMQDKLLAYNKTILVVQQNFIKFLTSLHKSIGITNLLSHEETGINITYDRDKLVKSFCKKQNINWVEYQNNGVLRGKKNRKQWIQNW